MMEYEKGRRALVVWMALAGLGAAGACGNVTSGGFGDADVVMSSGEVSTQESTASDPVREGNGGLATSHLSQLRGTLTVRARTFVRTGDGDFVELTDGLQELTLPLDDPAPVQVASRSLPAGRYDAVRTVFEGIEAEVLEGLVIDGLPVIGTVRVDLGDPGSLSVVTETDVEVWENAPTTIALEMRSDVWLRLAADAGELLWLVAPDDFRSAFRVRAGPSAEAAP